MLNSAFSPFFYFTLTLALLFSGISLAGEGKEFVCEGGINIFENGNFKLTLSNNEGQDLSRYSALSSIEGQSQIWLLFTADRKGDLTFRASTDEGSLQMAVFKPEKGAVCEEISNGIAEILRLHTKSTSKTVGLDYSVETGVLYALSLNQGDQIAIMLSSTTELSKDIALSWNYIVKNAVQETKIVDRRNDDFAPTQAFIIRDKVTKNPILVNLALEGSRDIDGLYMGSEFYFNLERNTKLSVKCDAEGYFYHDSLYEINAFEDNEIVIELDRIAAGKSICIKTIEFIPGESEIKTSSLPDLRRLRDFLALNSDINVEIQGHVFALGENTFAAQRISEARAKRILKYLTDNGIDKSRLTAVGYGNTRPIFEEPKFSYEEQANRRVEIVVK